MLIDIAQGDNLRIGLAQEVCQVYLGPVVSHPDETECNPIAWSFRGSIPDTRRPRASPGVNCVDPAYARCAARHRAPCPDEPP